ncbi:hypothetical protein AUJ65_05020 [Candidatus Micrarchaeota archaeon CG1_02_51_15]|nr:MAG: hypothetical protein AUJ65_05020 [Candidatus Micrarchaeota archaeon CG1_02_51_15]
MLPGIKRIGFDLDGCLYVMRPEIEVELRKHACEKIVQHTGITYEEAKTDLDSRYRLHSSLKTCLQELGVTDPNEVARESLARANVEGLLEEAHEVRAVLRQLKEKGFAVDLITKNEEPVARRRLAKLGLLEEFGFAVAILSHKREGFLKWVELSRCSPSELFYVGDRVEDDVRTPRSLGINAALVDYSSAEPAFYDEKHGCWCINHLKELLSIGEKEAKRGKAVVGSV